MHHSQGARVWEKQQQHWDHTFTNCHHHTLPAPWGHGHAALPGAQHRVLLYSALHAIHAVPSHTGQVNVGSPSPSFPGPASHRQLGALFPSLCQAELQKNLVNKYPSASLFTPAMPASCSFLEQHKVCLISSPQSWGAQQSAPVKKDYCLSSA